MNEVNWEVVVLGMIFISIISMEWRVLRQMGRLQDQLGTITTVLSNSYRLHEDNYDNFGNKLWDIKKILKDKEEREKPDPRTQGIG